MAAVRKRPFHEHPLVEALDRRLAEAGYAKSGVDAETGGVEWACPLFPGYRFEIFIWPTTPKFAGEQFGFNVYVSVGSARQTDVERLLDLRSCDQEALDDMPVREWAPVLSTSLGWLMGALEPRVGPFRETMQRWSSVSSADYAVVAEDVAQRLLASGRAFQRMIDTPEKLASVLTKLPEFPGAANGAGPGSIAPHEYAAVLYRDLGDRRAALAVLERGTVELLNRDATDEEAEAVISCRTAKYRDWIAAH